MRFSAAYSLVLFLLIPSLCVSAISFSIPNAVLVPGDAFTISWSGWTVKDPRRISIRLMNRDISDTEFDLASGVDVSESARGGREVRVELPFDIQSDTRYVLEFFAPNDPNTVVSTVGPVTVESPAQPIFPTTESTSRSTSSSRSGSVATTSSGSISISSTATFNGTTSHTDSATVTLPNSTSTSTTGTASTRKSVPVGPVVGGTVGGLAVLFVLVFLLLRCRRRQRRKASLHQENLKEVPQLHPYTIQRGGLGAGLSSGDEIQPASGWVPASKRAQIAPPHVSASEKSALPLDLDSEEALPNNTVTVAQPPSPPNPPHDRSAGSPEVEYAVDGGPAMSVRGGEDGLRVLMPPIYEDVFAPRAS